MAQTVPRSAKTESVLKIQAHLEEVVRGIDGNLFEELMMLSGSGGALGMIIITNEAGEKKV